MFGNMTETGERPESEGGDVVRPIRFLGMGLLIGWLCCTHITGIYVFDSPDARDAAMLGMRIGDIGMFFLLALASSRLRALSRHKRLVTVAVLATTVGTAIVPLWLSPLGVSHAGLLIAGIVSAIGGAVLFCLWAEVFCRMSATAMVIYGGGSCVVAFLVFCLVGVMRQPYAVMATALLPLLSLLCASSSLQLVGGEPDGRAGMDYPIPWKLVAIMTIAGFASGLLGVLVDWQSSVGAVHRIVATGLVGVALVYAAFRSEAAYDLRALATTCLVFAVTGLLITPLVLVGLADAVSLLVKLAYVWFTTFTLLLLASMSFRFDIPSLRLFAIARGCSETGILIGVLSRNAIAYLLSPFNLYTLLAMSGLGLLLVGACVLIWRSERSVNGDWGASGIDMESGMHEPSPRERLLARCAEIRDEYGLTERETEFLTLIVQGKTRSEIERELFVSQNTVKTHARHLYAKLDVHSKEEARKLVGIELPDRSASDRDM